MPRREGATFRNESQLTSRSQFRGSRPTVGINETEARRLQVEEMLMKFLKIPLILAACSMPAACGDDDSEVGTNTAALACDAEPIIMTTSDGIEFVRTPDACFEALPGWPFAPEYVEIDGLRQAYVDEGPENGPVVLLLHGQPSWSYLYRKMIPVLANAGYRVIAMDHLGMGRSDKPINIESYSYLGHSDRLLRFIEQLDLQDVNLFVQDWGSLIGLRVAGRNAERFARIAVGNGTLPVIPTGTQPYPPVENPNEIEDIPSGFTMIPEQQVPFYDGCDPLVPDNDFGSWMIYAMKAESFRPSEVLEGLTWFDLPSGEEAAYDAPFPSRTYMAGVRTFPSLINDLPGLNEDAWAGLTAFERPFATIWAANDPGGQGRCETQNELVLSIKGSVGMPHDRLPEASHFLQDDQGPQIAGRLVDIFAAESLRFDLDRRYCEVLLVRNAGSVLEAEVWGTQNISQCADASWQALDPDAIQAETEAVAVILNGPRIGLIDSSVISGGPRGLDRATFGDLRMRYLATLQLEAGQSRVPYTEQTVRRTSRFTYVRGSEVYRLMAPDGAVYVMISLSQSVDPELAVADLPNLAERLTLPEGWTYDARTLDADVVLEADGLAAILQDDLQNTYQRTVTSTSGESMPLPIVADGTGTPCTSDGDCGGLDAALCLGGPSGGFCSVEGCGAGSCSAPYLCCFDCSPSAAPLLPFEGSACIPAEATAQLAEAAGCTCQ